MNTVRPVYNSHPWDYQKEGIKKKLEFVFKFPLKNDNVL
jgi:hypothetical protein